MGNIEEEKEEEGRSKYYSLLESRLHQWLRCSCSQETPRYYPTPLEMIKQWNCREREREREREQMKVEKNYWASLTYSYIMWVLLPAGSCQEVWRILLLISIFVIRNDNFLNILHFQITWHHKIININDFLGLFLILFLRMDNNFPSDKTCVGR